MRTPARAAVGAVGFIAGVLLTVLAVRGVLRLYWLNYNGATPAQVVAWELLAIAVPVLGGWLVARFAIQRFESRQREEPRLSWRKRGVVALCTVILAGYAATWAFGVPAVSSLLTANDIAEYKSALRQNRVRSDEGYPLTRTVVAIPAVPGVVVTYHEMQVAGLWGRGEVVWAVWWPGHANVFKTTLRWIS